MCEENLKFEPANPDFVGYPDEDKEWFKAVDEDKEYQAEQEKLNSETPPF